MSNPESPWTSPLPVFDFETKKTFHSPQSSFDSSASSSLSYDNAYLLGEIGSPPPPKEEQDARGKDRHAFPRSWLPDHFLPAKFYSPVGAFTPHAWPSSSQTLKRGSPAKRASSLVWDVILTLTPLAFIVLTICASRLDGQKASRFGQNILEAQKLGPSIFPVIFAALLGRLMTHLARWKAERGSRLGLLEQLNGSQSLFTAIERIVLLHRWGPVGLSIVLLWALSPLGGQSSLRLLSVKAATATESASLRYLNTNMTFARDMSTTPLSASFDTVQALLHASFAGSPSRRRSSVDAWGNVKIPFLESLPSYQPNDDSNPWLLAEGAPSSSSLQPAAASETSSILDISRSNISYSSLVGVVAVGIPEDAVRVDFPIESSYIMLDCPELQYSNADLYDFYGTVGPLVINSNATQLDSSLTNEALPSSFFLDINQREFSGPNPNLIYLKYFEGRYTPGKPRSNIGWTWANCSVSTRHVESNVSCSGGICGVTHMRRSLVDARPGGESFFPPTEEFSTTLSEMLDLISRITTPTTLGINAITTYLVNPDDRIYVEKLEQFQPLIRDVSARDFSFRLSQVLNSCFQLIWAPSYVGGGAPRNLTVYGNGSASWRAGQDLLARPGDLPFPNNATTAIVTVDSAPVYIADNRWIAILLLISLIMLASAVAGTILKHICKTPRILGHVSSLTRDNPYVRLPPGGTALDGLERARLLGDMFVQIGDVREDEQVGHVALKSGAARSPVLDKHKRYH